MLTEVEKCDSLSEAAHPTEPTAPQSEPRPSGLAAGPATSGCHSRTRDLNAGLQTQNTKSNQPSVTISKDKPEEGEVSPPVSILKSKSLEGQALSPQQPQSILKTRSQSFPHLSRGILETQSQPIKKPNPQSILQPQHQTVKPRRAILVLPRSQCLETATGVTIQPENLEIAPRGRSPRARVRADPVSPRGIAQDGSDGSPRGRPRAENLNNLMARGATSPSSLKCPYCHRIFPRVKSLQVHLRTHTGEKPFVCTYPQCTRRFAQSGQLKTHTRLHTGEKPFACVRCGRRYTHSNRHCPDHPDLSLRRTPTLSSSSSSNSHSSKSSGCKESQNSNASTDSSTSPPKNWLMTNKRRLQVTNDDSSQWSPFEETYPLSPIDENTLARPGPSWASPNRPAKRHRSSGSYELPKKRWLREAFKEQQYESSNDLALQELAHPIDWGESDVRRENLRRPTVLMTTQDQGVTRADIQTAMALVQLKRGGRIEENDEK